MHAIEVLIVKHNCRPPEKYNCFDALFPTKKELSEVTKMLLAIAKYTPGLLPGQGPGSADPRPISFAFRP